MRRPKQSYRSGKKVQHRRLLKALKSGVQKPPSDKQEFYQEFLETFDVHQQSDPLSAADTTLPYHSLPPYVAPGRRYATSISASITARDPQRRIAAA